jgi:hypothetical protein
MTLGMCLTAGRQRRRKILSTQSISCDQLSSDRPSTFVSTEEHVSTQSEAPICLFSLDSYITLSEETREIHARKYFQTLQAKEKLPRCFVNSNEMSTDILLLGACIETLGDSICWYSSLNMVME